MKDTATSGIAADVGMARSRRRAGRTLRVVAGVAAIALVTFALVRIAIRPAAQPSHANNRFKGSVLGPPTVLTLNHPLGPGSAEVSLAEAARGLDGPVTLPDSAQAQPSDVGAAWLSTASDGAGHSSVGVGVTFPTRNFIIQYLRPPIPDPLANYQNSLTSSPGSELIYLHGGVPALAIPLNADRSNWGSVEFVAGGTTIIVMGLVDQSTLQAVAQSVLDRSNAG